VGFAQFTEVYAYGGNEITFLKSVTNITIVGYASSKTSYRISIFVIVNERIFFLQNIQKIDRLQAKAF